MKDTEGLLSCSACGLLMRDDMDAYQINCPRCESDVRKNAYSLKYRLGLAIASLIMFVPAMSLPILTFKFGDSEQVDTMFSSLYYFYQDGYPELSVVVFFTSIFGPFTQIIISILMLYPLSRNKKPRYMKLYYKVLFEIRHWVMLDVYVIAILVSIVKLSATSETLTGPGLVMFVFLMIFSFLLAYTFSPKQIWRAYHDAH